MAALLKFSLKTNIVKSIFSEIYSKVSNYYYVYGKTTPWEEIRDQNTNNIISDELIVPVPVDSYSYEIETRRNMTYMKLIDSNDACIVIKRINWVGGRAYDMYDDYSITKTGIDDITSLSQASFYVLTSDYNVYKCLYNNYGALSINQPTGTSIDHFETADGYIWKFMYTIPLYLRQKFMNSLWMPVTTALSNQFYSSGGIVDYNIEDPGSEYEKTTWKVKNIAVLNAGLGYTNGDEIIFETSPGVTAHAVVVVTNEIGTVDSITVDEAGGGYITQPISSIELAATGNGLQYVVEFERENTSEGSEWTEIVVTGDGFNEKNPYSLKLDTIQPTEGYRGSFVSPGPVGDSFFNWPTPQKAYGYKPRISIVYRDIVGDPGNVEIDYITVIDPGYGYTVPLEFGNNVTAPLLIGFSCSLGTEAEQKNDAQLIPLIGDDGTLHDIIINENGIGYTYANINVKLFRRVAGGGFVEIDEAASEGPTYKSGFRKARIALNFSIGDIETKQSTVELLAVNGSIPVVQVENQGSGYQSTDVVTIIGDGTGFEATAIVGPAGNIKSINVTNQGAGYSYATIVVGSIGTIEAGIPDNNSAIFRPIIAPKGGHGKDAVSELFAHVLMLTNRLGLEKIHQINFNDPNSPSYYRQIALLKNPYKFNSKFYYRNATGSATALLVLEKTGNESFLSIENDMTMKLISNLSKTYTVIGKTEYMDKYYILVSVNDNLIPTSGSSLSFIANSQTLYVTTSSVVPPEIDKFSGEVLYIDNRTKFFASEDQTIIASTLLSF
jgi:hypothetical protein